MTMTLEARRSMGSGPLSERFDDALLYASRHHREQLRKGSRVPYMTHLMSVSGLVLEHGGTQDQAIAGLLHDAVEDAPPGEGGAVLAEIRQQFGAAVADMVAACSDGLNDSGERKGTWQERKQAYVDGLPHKSLDALLVTPLVSTLTMRGDGHGSALLNSVARTPRLATVAVPGIGLTVATSYDRWGRLAGVAYGDDSVTVTVPPGGFTIALR